MLQLGGKSLVLVGVVALMSGARTVAIAGFLVFVVALAATVPSTPTRTVPPSPTFTTTTTLG